MVIVFFSEKKLNIYMDIFYNSLTNFPESTNDYISNVIHTKLPNTYGFLAVIVVFFFSFLVILQKSNSMASPSFESNSNSMSLELILIVVFIILVVFNLVYLNTESLI